MRWYSVLLLLALLSFLPAQVQAVVMSSTPISETVAESQTAYLVPPVACNTTLEALREFAESAEARRISGDEAFEVVVAGASPDIQAILVDVESQFLDFWILEFILIPVQPNQNRLRFEPVGFGCPTCVLVIGSGPSSKCTALIVDDPRAPGAPDGQLALGTFISGGIDGNSGPAKQRNSAGDSTVSPIRPELQQSADAPACGLAANHPAPRVFALLMALLAALGLLQWHYRKEL